MAKSASAPVSRSLFCGSTWHLRELLDRGVQPRVFLHELLALIDRIEPPLGHVLEPAERRVGHDAAITLLGVIQSAETAAAIRQLELDPARFIARRSTLRSTCR